MHLIRIIIRIYHDARSSECQIRVYVDRIHLVGQIVYSYGKNKNSLHSYLTLI